MDRPVRQRHLAGCCVVSGSTARHRGAALLLAMLTVALVASFAAAALWRQWREVEVETAERTRAQAAWLLTGAFDWARQILRVDAQKGELDHVGEPWAKGLQEMPLSSFLAADKNSAGATGGTALPEVFLSSQLTDMQSRLNVMNLLDGNKLSRPDVAAFTKLFSLLDLPQAELSSMAEDLRRSVDTESGAPIAGLQPLRPKRVEQLVWLGLSPATLARLRPYICVLPARTPVNLNTASAEVLYSSIPGLAIAQARRLVEARARSPFLSLDEAERAAGPIPKRLQLENQSVSSRFFEVRNRLRVDPLLIEERALLQRDGTEIKALWRERVSQASQGNQAATPVAAGTQPR